MSKNLLLKTNSFLDQKPMRWKRRLNTSFLKRNVKPLLHINMYILIIANEFYQKIIGSLSVIPSIMIMYHSSHENIYRTPIKKYVAH